MKFFKTCINFCKVLLSTNPILQTNSWFAVKDNNGLYKLYAGKIKYDSFSKPIGNDKLTWSQVKYLQEIYWNPSNFDRYLSKQEIKYLKDCRDKDGPNLFVNKIMSDGRITCQIIRKHKNNFHIKILAINDKYLNFYLDVGKVYPVFKHEDDLKDFEVWKISGKRMKRNNSQLLLSWERGIGWRWNLDM